MRMIGIGLMGFLLAGVALLLSTTNFWDRVHWTAQSWINSPQLVFETPTALPALNEYQADIKQSNSHHPIILSGLPSYQGLTFNLPMNARPTSGYLQIDATAQVLEGVEGALRVSIDNVRRGEVLLHPGMVSLSLQVPLSPTELARQQLVVSISLQGNGPHTQCQSDTGLAAIVEIETTSAIRLTLDQPLTAPIDRMNAWGAVVRVGWPQWLDTKEQARRLVLATQIKQQGISTLFLGDHSADAFTTTELREVIPHLEVAQSSPVLWPRQVAKFGANAGLRKFQTETLWRSNIDLRDDPERLIPTEFDLHLALGRQALEDRWTITVTLNGRFLKQDILEQAATTFDAVVTLPLEMMRANNVIEVSASSSRTTRNDCSRPQELIAEMLPNTSLVGGEDVFTDPLGILQTQLSEINVLRVGAATHLNAVDAAAASELLAALLPIGVSIKPDTQKFDVVVIAPSDTALTLPDASQVWFVTQDVATGHFIVEPVTSNAVIARRALGLLVTLGGVDLSEVAL